MARSTKGVGRTTTTPARYGELDVLRGLAVLGMMLVNMPGDWGMVYAPLRHAVWHGWTLADMVFPTFLFSVGVPLGLSFPRPFDPAARRRFWQKVRRRTVTLILLGIALGMLFVIQPLATGGGQDGFATLRLLGILQRIGLCYLLGIVAIVATGRRDPAAALHIDPAGIALVIAGVLIGYWLLLTLVPVPGLGTGRLDQEGNLGAWLDRKLFTPAHLWLMGWTTPGGPIVYDPEGLLSTLPATTNMLFGVLAGHVWRHRSVRAPMLIGGGGALLIAAGLALDSLFPINKSIWTSSFALLSSGFSAIVLAALFPMLRHPALVVIAKPTRVLGANAMLAFLIATLLERLFGLPLLPGAVAPQTWLNHTMITLVGDPLLASLFSAMAMAMLVVAMLWPLYRRGYHFRL